MKLIILVSDMKLIIQTYGTPVFVIVLFRDPQEEPLVGSELGLGLGPGGVKHALDDTHLTILPHLTRTCKAGTLGMLFKGVGFRGVGGTWSRASEL